jgi:hypothetical protein
MRVRAMLLTGVLAAGSIISACTSSDTVTSPPSVRPEQPPRPSPPFEGSCVAAEARWAIGQRASDDLLERARVAAKAALARFLLPNQPITTEYLGSRLNLGLDERNVVHAVSCG